MKILLYVIKIQEIGQKFENLKIFQLFKIVQKYIKLKKMEVEYVCVQTCI